MKKIVSLFLIIMICVAVCSCSSNAPTDDKKNDALSSATNNNNTVSATTQKVQLTNNNITDYVDIGVLFTNAKYENGMVMNRGYSTMDISALGTISGLFEDVKITVQVNSVSNCNLSNKTDGTPIELTITLPLRGDFEQQTYNVECDIDKHLIRSACDFTIVSVSGTFTPN